MPLDSLDNVIANGWPVAEAGSDPSALATIYNDSTNIAIWQREQHDTLEAYAQAWSAQQPSHTPKVMLSLSNMNSQLETLLPDLDGKALFKEDIALLVDMFACLFDLGQVGLRLTPLTKAMCPRFHVDNIPCRLVTSYGGLGTQWLAEDNLNRQFLGRGANGLSDDESGIMKQCDKIQQLATQDVAILKGSGWEGNEHFGIVHRSPALAAGQTRLLLTLDIA